MRGGAQPSAVLSLTLSTASLMARSAKASTPSGALALPLSGGGKLTSATRTLAVMPAPLVATLASTPTCTGASQRGMRSRPLVG